MSLRSLYNNRRKFNTLHPPTVELCQTNFELRQELDKEVKINVTNEAKIKCLERQLDKYENELLRLNKLIENFESKEKSNKKEIADLRLELKKSNTICGKKEKYILYQESELLNSQEIIYKLKKRIHIMAQASSSLGTASDDSSEKIIQPPNFDEHKELFHDVQVKCIHISEFIKGKKPSLSVPDIVKKLAIITDSAHRLHDIVKYRDQQESRNLQSLDQLQNQIRQVEDAYAQLQNQIQQINQDYAYLQNQLATANNNFNILNQAFNFRMQELQVANSKYNKWKNKAKTGPDIIWIINFPN